MEATIRLNQIYVNLLGEGDAAGLPVVYVELSGCRISCDLPAHGKRLPEGTEISIDEVAERVQSYGLANVYITGGEPLLQGGALPLAKRLLEKEMTVYIETNCTLEPEGLDPQLIRIADLKCPSNGTCYQIRWDCVERLGQNDCVKFVISDRGDYVWARDVIKRSGLEGNRRVYLIPLKGVMACETLLEWVVADKLQTRLHFPPTVSSHGVVTN